MTHDLLAEPEQCAGCQSFLPEGHICSDYCRVNKHLWGGARARRAEHPAAQDAAIAQAVRAAAGSENPVAWVLWSDENISASLDFRWHNIADELRKLVNPTGGRP